MLPKILHDYLGFNKQQRNGFVFLCCLSAVLLCVRVVYPLFMTRAVPQVQLAAMQAFPAETSAAKVIQTNDKISLHAFDPNTVSQADLQSFGMSEKSATTFVRFREKGFVFKSAEDLKKVYGISPSLYASLSPFVHIQAEKKSPQKNSEQIIKQTQVLELNAADSIALIALPGIGPSFAKRILKYRSLLGGYVKIEQLLEVYGFTEEQFAKVKNLVKVDASLIRLVDLSNDDFKTLTRHPYIGYEVTKRIFDEREKGGPKLEQLCELPFAAGNCEKLKPYLRPKP
jgi:DNA uptake protein ComE-like DNA-binding protein